MLPASSSFPGPMSSYRRPMPGAELLAPFGMRAMSTAPELPETEVAALKEKSRVIFGALPWSPVRTGNKVLRKKLVGDLFDPPNNKPFEDIVRSEFPDFLTDHEERRRMKLQYMRRRGKGPPKKGMGKRAQKASKKK